MCTEMYASMMHTCTSTKHSDRDIQNTASMNDMKKMRKKNLTDISIQHILVCLPKFACRHLHALTQTHKSNNWDTQNKQLLQQRNNLVLQSS